MSMERLTDNTNYCTSWSDCEMPEGACVFLKNCYDRKIYNKLREYEDAEEQGLLLRLPCKVGDTVYYVQKCLAPSCKECKGFTKVNNCYTEYKARIFEQEFDFRHLKPFGKSVFLTKEEAEAALAEMEK